MRTYDTPFGKLPSVTTILSLLDKPGLALWYGKHGTKKAKELTRAAGDRGSAVHAYAEHAYKQGGGTLDTPKSALSYCRSFMKLFEVYHVAPLLLEKVVYSKDGYAGTLDFAGDDGITVVLDWKTSKRIYFSHAMQVSAYAWAAREMGLIHSPILPAIVRLKEDGKFPEIKEVPEWERIYSEAWLPLVAVFQASQKPARWLRKVSLCETGKEELLANKTIKETSSASCVSAPALGS